MVWSVTDITKQKQFWVISPLTHDTRVVLIILSHSVTLQAVNIYKIRTVSQCYKITPQKYVKIEEIQLIKKNKLYTDVCDRLIDFIDFKSKHEYCSLLTWQPASVRFSLWARNPLHHFQTHTPSPPPTTIDDAPNQPHIHENPPPHFHLLLLLHQFHHRN